MAIRAVALFLFARRRRATALLRLEHLGLGQRLVQFLGGFLQRQAGGSAVHRLTGKLIQIHLDIRRDDHQIRRSHFFRGDGVAGTDGAARFHLHPPAAFLRFAFNGFGRHKGVRHAGWASGDRHDAFLPIGFHRRRRLRCLIGFSFGLGARQKSVRFTHRLLYVAHIHQFAVQPGISRG